MEINKVLLNGYENMGLIRYEDPSVLSNTVAFDEIGTKNISGVLKANLHVNGRLMQTYTEQENHVAVIAATRLGKTTSYVIPSIISFAKQKIKKSLIISDPKGEIYRNTAETLRSEGYRVVLLNFRDYLHTECWNMLTPIFRKYRKVFEVVNEVEVVSTEKGPRNSFKGKIYEDQLELDEEIDRFMSLLLDDVGNDIDILATMIVDTKSERDPYWEDAARDLFKAFIWAMLEDSDPEKCDNPITEDTFSMSTILSIVATFKDGGEAYYNDNGYFTNRGINSRAYALAKNTLIENARQTRKCVLGAFMTKMTVFNEVAMRLITSCNSFEISELANGPIAIFIDYRDELKVHYQVISLFIQDAYRFLIETANDKPNGKLEVPVYFILDEFGNFPALKDFETTISACAGRNIFFILIIQSYAQLNNVYGEAVAEIIRDNLNVHIFFGSNNPKTIEAFSNECGLKTRISPLSALNGNSPDIDNYMLETIPLVPKSALTYFNAGECIVTEANCGYVMYSKLERYYLCDEMKDLKLASEKDYKCPVNPFDRKYRYVVKINPLRRPMNIWDSF